MPEFRFAFPAALILLLPALMLLISWGRGTWRGTPAVMRYSDTRLLSGLSAGMRVRLRRIPDVLRLMAWLGLVIALARPQAGVAETILRGEGVDIVIALDISDSMGAQDFEPYTRLEAAKRMTAEFINGRAFDRMGLVVFAENAFYQTPPTLDYTLLNESLQSVQLASRVGLNGSRTALGLGIASAVNMLREGDQADKALIVLTDGANNAGTIDPLSATQAAQAFGIRVYTIGMGTRGTALTLDAAGDIITTISDLDEPLLQSIAAAGNGRYFNALDMTDLGDIYAEIDRLEASAVEQRLLIRWQDQAEGLLMLSLMLLVLERILRQTVFQTIP